MSGQTHLMLVVMAGLLSCDGRKAGDEPPPGEELPWKLWLCDIHSKHCRIFARFQSQGDCEQHVLWMHAVCDPKAPRGSFDCQPRDPEVYTLYWATFFTECTQGSLTYRQVHGSEGWIR